MSQGCSGDLHHQLSDDQSTRFFETLYNSITSNQNSISRPLAAMAQLFRFSDSRIFLSQHIEKLHHLLHIAILRCETESGDKVIQTIPATLSLLITCLDQNEYINEPFKAAVYAVRDHPNLFSILSLNIYGQPPATVEVFLTFLTKFFNLFTKNDKIEDIALEPFIKLREGALTISLMSMIEEEIIPSKGMIQQFITCYEKVLRLASFTPLDIENSIHLLLIRQALIVSTKSLDCSSEEARLKAGFSSGSDSDLMKDFATQLSLLEIIDLISFLGEEGDLSFRKLYTEQLMFTDQKYCLPLLKAAKSITNFLISIFRIDNPAKEIIGNLKNLTNFVLGWDTLYFQGMAILYRMWKSAKAQNVDFENMEKVMRVLTSEVIGRLTSSATITDLSDLFNSFSYQDLRRIQLENYEQNLQRTWRLDLEALESKYTRETESFMQEQRVLSLIRGSWGFAENPLQFRDAKVMFCAVSPNRQSILFKVFRTRPLHYTAFEQDCQKVDLTQVQSIVATDITPSSNIAPGQRLINLASRSVFMRITLVGRDSKKSNLLTFYTNKTELGLEWSDGLSILINKPDLSDVTKQHVIILTELKKKLQLMELTDEDVRIARLPIPLEPQLIDIDPNDFYFR